MKRIMFLLTVIIATSNINGQAADVFGKIKSNNDSAFIIEDKALQSFGEWSKDNSTKWDMTFSEPKGFVNTNNLLIFAYNNIDKQKARPCEMYYPCFVSNDKECLIGLSGSNFMHSIANKDIKANSHIADAIYGVVDTTICRNINPNDYVTTFSSSVSKRLANADAIHLVDMPLSHTLDNKWAACKYICLEKANRPIAYMIVLLSKKGMAQAGKYVSDAMNIYRYGNNQNWIWPDK